MCQKAKTCEYQSIWGNRITIPKTFIMSFPPYCVPKRRNTCKELYEKKKRLPNTCIMNVFDLVRYHKFQSACKAPDMGKEDIIAKNVSYQFFFFLFSFLRTKTLKRMENTLYGESEQHDQKHVFRVFSCLVFTKTPKCLQNTLFGVTKGLYQKRVI